MPGRILTQQGADLLEIRGADAAALEEGIGVHLPQGLRPGGRRVQHEIQLSFLSLLSSYSPLYYPFLSK